MLSFSTIIKRFFDSGTFIDASITLNEASIPPIPPDARDTTIDDSVNFVDVQSNIPTVHTNETEYTINRPPPRITAPLFDATKAIYVVFDLETTGLSRERNFIIEIACELLSPDGVTIPDSRFASLVRPPTSIPPFISNITGITDDMVLHSNGFETVGKDFLLFIIQKKNYRLVAWKDRDIVYCLTNVTPTVGTGSCYRRSTGGRILLERPNVIEEYNRYMGGVDIADQRRLHSNCTIMGQHRWWLKLLFYLLDVSTANALILYKSTLEESDRNALNIDAYKKKLVYGWLGTRMEEVPTAPTTIHELIRTDNRVYRCQHLLLINIINQSVVSLSHESSENSNHWQS